ncbi:hypothetical protein SCLCIDRAFT_764332 [Scleroderma citrinum Foug A]|uniref:Uncharacterized protein n=1 Tax=Scleroderma citrinum Foug A TaxID=1036808 RepID=A0A0C3AEA3_9AGAM|nr:hypothetical protein SCLCIDRAFT_764332 [Scleroderma citrinum Foug A]
MRATPRLLQNMNSQLRHIMCCYPPLTKITTSLQPMTIKLWNCAAPLCKCILDLYNILSNKKRNQCSPQWFARSLSFAHLLACLLSILSNVVA